MTTIEIIQEHTASAQVLMEKFHTAQATGGRLTATEQKELENLVDAEWRAAIQRTQVILNEAQRLKEHMA